jgi:hypothetical protein
MLRCASWPPLSASERWRPRSRQRFTQPRPHSCSCLRCIARPVGLRPCERRLGGTTAPAKLPALTPPAQELREEELTPGAFREHAAAAVHCYLAAIQAYLSSARFALAAALYAEVAEHLRALGSAADAAALLDKAAQLAERESPRVAEDLIVQVVELRVGESVQDWSGALDGLVWLADVAQRRAARAAPWAAERERAQRTVADALVGQALVRAVLGEWGAGREALAALHAHVAGSLTGREAHTVWLPLLSALIDAAQAHNARPPLALARPRTLRARAPPGPAVGWWGGAAVAAVAHARRGASRCGRARRPRR